MSSSHVFSGLPFERNQKVSSWQTILDRLIPLKRFPEVSRPSGVHKRKRCDRQPALEYLRQRELTSYATLERAYGRSVDESPHRMVEQVISYSHKISIKGTPASCIHSRSMRI